MKNFFNSIADFFKGDFLDFLNRGVSLFNWDWLRMWHILCAGLAVLIILLVIIIVCAKKSKKKKKEKDGKKTAAPAEEPTAARQPEPQPEPEPQKEEVKEEPQPVKAAEPEPQPEPEPEPEKKAPAKKAAPAAKKPAAKKAPAKKPAAKKPAAKAKTTETTVRGKYVIEFVRNGKYRFALLANNGNRLFESEEYSGETSCRNGIANFKKYITETNKDVVEAGNGKFQYVIKRPNGSYTSKVYDTEAAAKSAAVSVQRFGESENIIVVK